MQLFILAEIFQYSKQMTEKQYEIVKALQNYFILFAIEISNVKDWCRSIESIYGLRVTQEAHIF